MKLFTVLVLATLSLSSFAEMKDEDVSKMKSVMTENLDKRISYLQETKACVNKASTKEQIRECHKKLKSSMEELRKSSDKRKQEWSSKRKERKEKKDK